MASSAYVKWRVVAGALSLAVFFILTGVSEMINNVFRVTWGHVLDSGLGGQSGVVHTARSRSARRPGGGSLHRGDWRRSFSCSSR